MSDETPIPPAPEAAKKPRLSRAAIRRAQRSLELLLAAQRLSPRSPAGRRLRQLERPWRAQLGDRLDAGTLSALRVAATQALLLERVDEFVLHQLPHPANRGKRALYSITRERQLIADRLLQMLEGLGLISVPVPTNNTELARAFAHAFSGMNDLVPPPYPAPAPPVPVVLALPAPEPEALPAPSVLPPDQPTPPDARNVSPPPPESRAPRTEALARMYRKIDGGASLYDRLKDDLDF